MQALKFDQRRNGYCAVQIQVKTCDAANTLTLAQGIVLGVILARRQR
jgi:hypothetical protein